MNAGKDDAVFTGAVVQGEFQELLALRYCFAGFDFHSAEVRLAEGIKVHIVLEERFDFHFGEINRFIVFCLCHFFRFSGGLLFQSRFRFHSREKEYVADGGGVCHEHEEAVKADAQSAGRRHAVFQGGEEIFINRMGFVITMFSFFYLQFKPFSLVNGVI